MKRISRVLGVLCLVLMLGLLVKLNVSNAPSSTELQTVSHITLQDTTVEAGLSISKAATKSVNDSFRGTIFTDKDKEIAQKLYKDIVDGKQVSTKSIHVVAAFDYLYLRYTNHSCLEKYSKKKYMLYKWSTLKVMCADESRIQNLRSANTFIAKQNNKILKDSGALKATTVKKKLAKIESYFIKNFKYDNDYKTGERTKWSQYQDAYGANVYYLYKNKKGICTDFVTAYKQLCSLMGISCRIEFGGTSDSTVRSHAWNVVNTGKGILYKDITLDIGLGRREWCKSSPKEFLEKHKMMVTY